MAKDDIRGVSGNPSSVQVVGSKSLGYEDLTLSTGTAQSLTVPSGATWARIWVRTGSIRFADDGTTATVSNGAPWEAGSYFETYAPAAASLIETSSATVSVEYH